MLKGITILVSAALLLVNICGCVALLAGAAGGAGTAAWLSGKLSQEVNASLDKVVKASKSALKSLKLDVTKEATKDNVAQFVGNYTDGRVFWVDIHRVSDSVSRVEVRVGAAGDKAAARKILDKIKRNL